jgi:hypothetical protein
VSDVTFFDESFRLAPREDYEWEMIEFATAAQGGADTNFLSGTAAVFTFLKAAIVAEDWPRFRALARERKAQTARDLMPVVVRAFAQQVDRPTGPPSASSDGPSSTPPSAEVDSYSRVIERLEAEGRPDVAYMVKMAQTASVD